MARNRNRNRAAQRDTRFTQRAQTNVELQDQSQVNQLQQQLQDAQRDYLRQGQAAQSIWGGGVDAIRGLPRPQFDQIGDQYTQALGSIADLFGGVGGMPEPEAAAGNALGQAYGEAGQTMLANEAAREGMARSSAARQMDLSGRYARDANVQRMEDAIRGYNDQLGQVRADDPWQVSQETQTLMDQALQQQLARSKMKSDAAFSQWLQGYLGGGGAPGSQRGPGGGGPGRTGAHGQPASRRAHNHPRSGMGGRRNFNPQDVVPTSAQNPAPGYWTAEPPGQVMDPGATSVPQPGWPAAPGPIATARPDLTTNPYDVGMTASPYDDYIARLLGG